ncbi:filamentous hemagglutinin N-terminal domain-containing protein [Serratia marcescens]|uniref:hemagglutinin repeat-containing protein n=1 Tax=Serratia TaxID=613 RepID=UPI00135B3C88|nr:MULTISPECIES: hemagglutinin repeat-containing protein [Serratia]NVC32677.1 filamentous hemagglutinin N-terminal domain-containing protein [Serratia marcescens]QIO29707.1 filamentous hemagglutinin N-terminal domain-containing protein [Serratia marcescens]QLB28086.1 filamentous hemagglutinin N-terminal domain-containing protein [Serratia marcescens]QPJ89041.1 hemagglutinin repeat-containing protein [Serratia marcescens]CAI1744394.1 Hemolysin precursor [Serratia marcescens]
MKNNNFRLSAAGKLAAALAIILAASAGAYAAEIVAANGANGPGVSTAATGAQVVDIVAPNGNGLSHNQYQDFNVNQPGAVLNNSREAGLSQLAGQLGANPNLGGREASVILNEVIGRNPSLLHGQQEIFGMAADYVLANPNGISCQGCGFINTSHSSLVVGNPLVENGVLQGYSTFGNRNTLSLNGTLNAGGVLDLIAPKIDSRGEVIVQDFKHSNGKVTSATINAISGLNRVARDGTVQASQQTPTALDSYYLGSMQAGRINIINTAQGSGVKLAGSLNAGDELKVKAYDIRSESRVDDASSNKNGGDNYQNYRGGIYVNDRSSSQKLTRTELKGKNISLVADNHAHLTATDIRGEDITLQGGKLTLDGQQLKQTQGHTDDRWFYSWQYDVTREREQLQQAGSTVAANGSAKLISTQEDVKLLGANVSAERALSVKAARDVHLAGLVEKDKSSERGYQRNHTSSLRTGRWSSSDESESLKASELRSQGELTLKAGRNVSTQGAKIHAQRDLTIDADSQIQVGVQKTANAKAVRDDKTSWGGIGGGDNKNNSNRREISHASELTSGGTLRLNGQQGVTITGSKARGQKGGEVTATHGGLRIDNALSTTVDKIDARTGTAFNITSSSHKADNSYQSSTASELKSDTNLTLVSHKDADVIGSQVASGGELSVESKTGNINVKAAERQQNIDEQKTALTVNGYAKEAGDKQYRAGLRIEHTRDSEKTTRTENSASSLSGGSVKLKAEKDVTFSGSQLVADKGDASVSGNKVSFLAADDKTASNTEQTKIGGGFYYTGGIDKLGSGVEAGYENSKTQTQSSKAITSGSDVKGNLTINARDKLTQQGAQHSVGGAYQENAAGVDHLAAADTASTTTTKTDVGVNIGANVDYSAVTRPVERAVGKAAKLDATGVINDIGGIGAPNVGLDIGAQGGSSEKHSSSSQAVVSSVKAGSIDINAKGEVRDQGTQYQASKGAVNLTADSHRSEAAANRQDEQSRDTRGSAGVRVYTTTGSDLTVDAKGEGGTQRSNSSASQAVAGSIDAANGINVNVKKDAVYQGTALNGGSGKTAVNAGGDIRFDQASDKQSENHSGFNVKASAKGGFTADSKNFGAGFGGGTNNGESSSSTAQVGNVNGQGVALKAGRDLTLQGTNVKSQGDVSLNAGNKVALQAAESTQTRKESKLSGNIDLGAGSSDSKEKTGGSLSAGGAFDIAKVNESTTERQGATIASDGKVTLSANGKGDDALHLQGAKVSGGSAALEAKNGGILLESAKNEQHKDNWNLGIKANARGGQTFNKDAGGKVDPNTGKDTHTLGAGLKVGVEQQDKTTHANTGITAGDVALNSGKDTRLAGARVDADSVQGKVGGDLRVESRKDVETGVKVDVDAGLSHSNDPGSSITSKLSKVGTPRYAGKVKEKLEAGVNKVADATTDKYNSVARRLDPQQDTTGAVSFSKADGKVTLPETPAGEKPQGPLWDRGARTVGGAVKDSITGPAGRQGQLKVNADVVNNNAVGEQSAIAGKHGVALQVGGQTQLTGGEIRSQQGKVELGGSQVSQQDVSGQRYQGGGRVDAAATVGGLLGGAAKQSVNGNVPFASGHASTQQADAKAGVFSGK